MTDTGITMKDFAAKYGVDYSDVRVALDEAGMKVQRTKNMRYPERKVRGAMLKFYRRLYGYHAEQCRMYKEKFEKVRDGETGQEQDPGKT